MGTMSLDLFLLKKELIETEEKFQETKGELRLMRKRAKSLSCISNELIIRKRELKRQIRELRRKK